MEEIMDKFKPLNDAIEEGRYGRRRDPETGKWSSNNGDFVIQLTKKYDNETMAQITAAAAGCTAGDLLASYIHMNHGMMRMNLNNKLRQTLLARYLEPEVRLKRLRTALARMRDKADQATGNIELVDIEDKIEFIKEQVNQAASDVDKRLPQEDDLRKIIKDLKLPGVVEDGGN